MSGSQMQVTLHNNRTAAPVKRLADSLEKPDLDTRTYRVVQLPNKLEALLIHDADTDKASAAMDVNVGSFSDEEDMPGMAHAVEHLLFMGTEKFPGENDYNQYLQSYGGYSNAYTASCDTNYYFELSATSSSGSGASSLEATGPLHGALDLFAQFFIKPLFLEDTLDRELRAVDSENKKNLQADTWRLHQLNKSLSNKKHPFHKFSTGNYKVLRDDPVERGVKIRDKFMEFYKKHYSANRMKLVVLGRESLDELEGWVTDLFSDVPNFDLPQLRWDDVPALSEKELGMQIFVKPVMDMRMLDIHFAYLDEDELWESQPSKYISHLLGHEAPGSILAYIKARGWANGLGAGPMHICPGTAHFSVSIRLTEDGLKNYKEVVKSVFQYIAMIKEHPPQEWVVTEMAQLADVDFKFKPKIPASKTTSSYSGVMQKPYPREKLLSAGSLIWKFDAAAISRGLDCLRADNFRFQLVSQEFPGDWNEKEKWYGTEYKYEPIPQDFLKELDQASKASSAQRPAELHMPHKNEFVPTRLDVEKKEVDTPSLNPKLIRNDENVRTWWKKDDQFWAPKANLKVCFRSALVNISALNAVLSHLFTDLVEDSLTEYSYDAELAGVNYEISNHAQGLDVNVSGYNDKMAVLLEKVLLAMRDLEISDDRFNIIKDRTLRGWRNFEFTQPFQQIGTYSRWLLSEKSFVISQLLEELPPVTADDVREFFPQALKQMHIEILAHGNLYREDALKITDLVEKTMHPKRLPASQWPICRSLVLPGGSNYVYKRTLADPQNVNHCVDYQLWTGLASDRELRAKLLVFAHIADEPCFDTLRSKEQLGYVVQSGATMLATVAGFKIIIQSERHPDYLEKRIELFLHKLGKQIEEMSEEEFEKNKGAVIGKREEKLKNLNQESGRFWHHITSEAYDFELVNRDVEHIRPLTKSQLVDFFNTYVSPSSRQTRSKLAVHLLAQNTVAEVVPETASQDESVTSSENKVLDSSVDAVEITDVRDFKAGVPLSEGLKAVKDITEFEELEAKL
ncbi:STE23-like protein [Delphinella strobiligena]|nr:STE23-like protein [Delphinella strobiligena]